MGLTIKSHVHDATSLTIQHRGPLGGNSGDTSTTDLLVRGEDGDLLTITLFYDTATGLPITTHSS